MAVEKSYARLGFFIVVALVVVLATAVLFIQRLRSRAVIGLVTYTTENVSGLDVSSPVRYRGVSVGRVTDLRVDPRGSTVEIDFEMFLDRLNTIGVSPSRIRQIADLGGVFPRLRAQIVGNPVTGEAYLLLDVPQNPPPPMRSGSRRIGPTCRRCPRCLRRCRIGCRSSWIAPEATLQTLREIVARIPDSLDRSDRFFTNVERIVQESELPALSADSRKFFATTSAQIEQITSEMDGLIGTEGTLSSSLKRRGPRSRRQTFRPRHGRHATRPTRPASRRTISGVPCRPFGIRSNSCANSRGSSRSSPSRWSTVPDHHRRSTDDSCAPIPVLFTRHDLDCLPWGSRLPAAPPHHHTEPHDRATTARAATRRTSEVSRRLPTPSPSGCSIHKRADTSAAVCCTSNRMVS